MAIASQCPYQDVRSEIIADVWDEEVGDDDAGGLCHIDVLYEEAAVCGISRDEITATEPTPPILASINALDNFSRTLGWLPGFAAIAALEIAHSEPAVRARERLTGADNAAAYEKDFGGSTFQERLGVNPDSLRFFALHNYKDRFHGGGELSLVVKYANTAALQREALWATAAGISVMGLMVREIVRLAFAALGYEPDQSHLAQIS